MPRRSVSAVFDVNESVKQLENELRVLTTQKQNLLTNVNDLEKQRDKLNIEINNIAEKITKIEKDAKVEVDRITKIANDKMEKANIREGESVELKEGLSNKIKEAENLIKSNEGLQKNLNLQSDAVEDKIKKIESFLDLIKMNLKNI